MPKFTETRERWSAVRADGKENYRVGSTEADARSFCARMPGYADAVLTRHVEEVPVAPYMQVILEAVARGDVPESAVSLISRDMQRMLNMSRDAGRPSDAARSSVAAYMRGDLTEESFEASRPSGFYPEDRS